MGGGRLGLLAVLAVAACAPLPSGKSSVITSAVPAPTAAVWRDQPRPLPKAGPRSGEMPALVGLMSRDIEGLLGRPTFVRRDGPAQIWQYGNRACTLNLFLYRDGAVLKVRHAEFRDRNADLVSAGGCDGVTVSMVQGSP
jgi:hypothetical protein